MTTLSGSEDIRLHIRVTGVVQGVGFRPFVFALTTQLGLTGWVANDADGVLLEVQGHGELIDLLIDMLRRDAPPRAVIAEITTRPLPLATPEPFLISASGQRRSKCRNRPVTESVHCPGAIT